MPFTFSHPAIILPLTYLPKKWFSYTGLVVGSLTPDFEYFIRMRIKSDYSHTIAGLFWFDIPLGILLCFIFHNNIKASLLDNFPQKLKARFIKLSLLDWNTYFKKNWFVVVISLLIGAYSHLFWDSFTHDHGYYVEHFPTLKKTLNIFNAEIPIFKILQHSSSLIGGIILLLAILNLRQIAPHPNKPDTRYWIILFGLTFLVIALRFLTGLGFQEYGNIIVTSISAGIIGLILAPFLLTRLDRY